MSRKRTSLDRASDLVRLFVARSRANTQDPSEAVCFHVRKLRADAMLAGLKSPLEAILRYRHIEGPGIDDALSCDGCLVPKGNAYADGFRILLRGGVTATRTRFTLAHEICHSFFYELVPEIKFSEHHTDNEEERLCNIGAAELLMPADCVQRDADGRAVSLSTLTSLSAQYGVSLDAMLNRLRALRLWSCELSVWHRMTNSQFALDRKMGGINNAAWKWLDPSIPGGVWNDQKGQSLSGRGFVGFADSQGRDYSVLVYYEAQRRGDAVFALWSRRKMPKAAAPMFRKQSPQCKPEIPSASWVA
jgi:hypothetical protein